MRVVGRERRSTVIYERRDGIDWNVIEEEEEEEEGDDDDDDDDDDEGMRRRSC